MKKLLFLAALSLMVFALVVGCGKKADEATDKVPVETKAADMMDSTRMDSMMHEGMDSVKEAATEMLDSAKAKIDGM